MNKKVAIFMVIVITIGTFTMLSKQENNASTNDNKTIQQEDISHLRTVNTEVFAEEITKENVVILDIRTPAEYQLGRIEASVNIDFYNPSFEDTLEELDKDVEYKIYCNSGNRSATTLNIMKDMGFTDVVELDGGIQAWMSNQQEVCTEC